MFNACSNFYVSLTPVNQVTISSKTVSHTQIISKLNYLTAELNSNQLFPLHILLRQDKLLLLLNSKS